jgi:hypothetical protein
METAILSITHHEVRRHPRWREEISSPSHVRLHRNSGTRLLGIVALLIVGTAFLVLFLNR